MAPALLALLMGAAPLPAQAASTETAVSCPAQPAALPPEFRGWMRQRPATAGATDKGAASIDVGPGVAATLLPAAKVTMAVQPAKPAAGATHAGLFSVVVPIEGRYRVGLSGGAWVDVVHDGAVVASVAHGHGPACSSIRKMVDFDLKPGRYLVQISGSVAPSLSLIVARLP